MPAPARVLRGGTLTLTLSVFSRWVGFSKERRQDMGLVVGISELGKAFGCQRSLLGLRGSNLVSDLHSFIGRG